MSNKQKLWLLVFLLMIAPAYALFGFDEFTDDAPQLITETIENDFGNVCTDCNASITVNNPDGTFLSHHNMTFNTSSKKYEVQLNLGLINENTTIYPITISANRTNGAKTINGTSDRTILKIYDIFPPVDSQWDVGLVILFLTIQWTFVLLAYRFFDEHVMVKYTFILISLFFNSWLMALGHRILIINGVITSNFTRLFDSTAVLGLVLNYLFTSYIMIYVLYYMIHSVMDSSKKLGRRLD